MKRSLCLGFALTLIALTLAACTFSTSVGGASVEFGRSRNDKTLELGDKSTTFKPGEHFIYVFKNGSSFNSSTLTIQLSDSATKEIILTHDYQVNKDNDAYSDKIWFEAPGKYTVQFLIDGKARATQEVIIQ
jgi:hypothetical protein